MDSSLQGAPEGACHGDSNGDERFRFHLGACSVLSTPSLLFSRGAATNLPPENTAFRMPWMGTRPSGECFALAIQSPCRDATCPVSLRPSLTFSPFLSFCTPPPVDSSDRTSNSNGRRLCFSLCS